MVRVAAILICCIGTLSAQQQDPKELLLAVRHNVMDTVNQLPKYMCTETIDRYRYTTEFRRHLAACDEPSGPGSTPKRMLTLSDRLRLDVATGPRREMYSWSGADQFDDRDLLDIVNDGSVSTGEFGAFLSVVFGSSTATFTYNGDMKDDKGRSLAEFGFTVSKDQSQYTFGNRKYETVTGFDGTFQVDEQTADLVRMTVRTNRLPEETGACDATTRLEYGHVRLNDRDFLLPAEAIFTVSVLNGNQTENRAVYSGCHEFHGESSVSFDSPELDVAGAHATPAGRPLGKPLPPPPLDIPAGLPFEVKLDGDIDTAKAAAGDLIRVRLAVPIKDRGKVLAAAGTVINGRIMRVQRNYGVRSSATVTIRLETIEADKVRPFAAKGEAAVQRFNAGAVTFTRQRVELGSLDAMEDGNTAQLFTLNPDKDYVFRSGTEMKCVTARPRTSANSEAAK